MVGFKKDNNKKSKLREAIGYLYIFIAGFIIAVFLTLYLVLHIVNVIRGNNETPIEPSSSEPTSSEPISSSEESSEEPSSSVDSYIEEKGIYQNLLDICKDYDDSVVEVATLNYDSDYLYISAISSDYYLHIFKGSLGSELEVLLESLASSKESFSVSDEIDTFDLSETSTIDVTSKEVFSNNDTYKGYTYNKKYNYYLDSLHDDVGLTAIGYKDNSYISFSYLIYSDSLDDIDDSLSYVSVSTDTSSIYYSFLDYLYHLD